MPATAPPGDDSSLQRGSWPAMSSMPASAAMPFMSRPIADDVTTNAICWRANASMAVK
jgi:hypothetical protein